MKWSEEYDELGGRPDKGIINSSNPHDCSVGLDSVREPRAGQKKPPLRDIWLHISPGLCLRHDDRLRWHLLPLQIRLFSSSSPSFFALGITYAISVRSRSPFIPFLRQTADRGPIRRWLIWRSAANHRARDLSRGGASQRIHELLCNSHAGKNSRARHDEP